MPDGPVYPPRNPAPLQKQLTSVYKAWNAAYRGLVPGGVRLPAPNSDPEYDEPETFTEQDYTITRADCRISDFKNIIPIPVVIMDDLQETRGRTEVDFEAYQFIVNTTTPVMIINRHGSRLSLRISNNGPGVVYLGKTESTGILGYACQVNEAMTLTTKKDVWACVSSGSADVSVIYEYEREII